MERNLKSVKRHFGLNSSHFLRFCQTLDNLVIRKNRMKVNGSYVCSFLVLTWNMFCLGQIKLCLATYFTFMLEG